MKNKTDEVIGTIIIVTGGVSFALGFMLGIYLSQSAPSTTYNNLGIVREQLQVTQNCLNGWSSTLELLRSCNEINK